MIFVFIFIFVGCVALRQEIRDAKCEVGIRSELNETVPRGGFPLGGNVRSVSAAAVVVGTW